ncbi:hypothetical protein F5141DRAFT_1065830 [Pisolithus sp. B1]|nr:hypothetical protein F5141DRAFT_1065830 [Pisolithus sp. B1]
MCSLSSGFPALELGCLSSLLCAVCKLLGTSVPTAASAMSLLLTLEVQYYEKYHFLSLLKNHSLKMKYWKQNTLLGQTGAGCMYEDLLSNDRTKNILAAIMKDFPWWANLHGWWHTNPAYNNTFSAADVRQAFAVHAVELFKLQLTPPAMDPETHLANLTVPCSSTPSGLEDGEIKDDEDMSVDDNSPSPPVVPPPFFEQASSHLPLDLCHSSLALLLPPHSSLALPSPHHPSLALLPPPPFFSEQPSPTFPSLTLGPLLPPTFTSEQHSLPHLTATAREMISLNNHPPIFTPNHPKIQPSHPSHEQPWDHWQKVASAPHTEESSNLDVMPSNFFSALHVSSSSPSSPFPSNDGDSKPSTSKQTWKCVKCHRLDLDYWKAQAKVTMGQEECKFQLLSQCEKHAHKLAMGTQEVKKMELVVQLEWLHAQNLTLQRGIAGGGDQGISGDQDVHPSPPSV